MSTIRTRDILRQIRNKKHDNDEPRILVVQFKYCVHVKKLVFKDDEVLVFGYASRLYENDTKAEWIAEEQHLIAHPADPHLLTDRYDCRLYLGSLAEFNVLDENGEGARSDDIGEDVSSSDTIDREEEALCEEERYKDLYEDIRRTQEEEEEKNKRRRAEIGFSYDERSKQETSSSSEEEIDEPFVRPDDIKLPLGMNLPETMKQNAVIERTATFVVAQGAQMEIVIKAKQRGNLDQFGFLEFDHPLNAYYKYISKMIREKKYVPKPHIPQRRPKLKKLRRLEEEAERKKKCMGSDTEKQGTCCNVETDSESDSDSGDHYLHPLLMGGASASNLKEGSSSAVIIGPKTREELQKTATPSPPPQVKIDYEIGKGNDVYSSLFNNLSGIVHSQSTPLLSRQSNQQAKRNENMDVEDEYVKWHISFYGKPPRVLKQPSMVPPPPDMTAAVNMAAEYAAKYGCQGEYILVERADLAWEFLRPLNPYYPYYQSRVRFYQAELDRQRALLEAEQAVLSSTVAETNGNETASNQALTNNEQNICDEVNEQESTKNKSNALNDNPAKGDVDKNSSAKEELDDDVNEIGVNASVEETSTSPVFMNRKMRRKEIQGSAAALRTKPPSSPQNEQPITQPTDSSQSYVVKLQMTKVHSSPALFVHENGNSTNASTSNLTKKPLAPISFSLSLPKADEQRSSRTSAAILGAYDDDDNNNNNVNSEANNINEVAESTVKGLDVPAGVVTNIPPPGLAIPPPPVAPIPLASGQLALEGSAELQLERKQRRGRYFPLVDKNGVQIGESGEKDVTWARLFMEKILNEKRAAKLRMQNEENQRKSEETVRENLVIIQNRTKKTSNSHR
ncbi:unnamed protein product [Anisakis simplex]|uniref:Protein suppressor of white apricot n=1 Tax=Anisakis simplex TaxID=6269 RepID=A0A0M3JW08_ANISI|nr:unnamed protein product [Anisakis simplex]